MGKIEARITSQDKEVQAATIRTSSGKVLNRELNFLYPLKCSELSGEKTNPDEINDQRASKDDHTIRGADSEQQMNAQFIKARLKQGKHCTNY